MIYIDMRGLAFAAPFSFTIYGNLAMKPRTVQELYSNPEKWTQHYLTRNSMGHDTGLCFSQAHCFCLMGAILYVYGNFTTVMREAENRLLDALGERYPSFRGLSYVAWNDAPERTIQEVQEIVKIANI